MPDSAFRLRSGQTDPVPRPELVRLHGPLGDGRRQLLVCAARPLRLQVQHRPVRQTAPDVVDGLPGLELQRDRGRAVRWISRSLHTPAGQAMGRQVRGNAAAVQTADLVRAATLGGSRSHHRPVLPCTGISPSPARRFVHLTRVRADATCTAASIAATVEAAGGKTPAARRRESGNRIGGPRWRASRGVTGCRPTCGRAGSPGCTRSRPRGRLRRGRRDSRRPGSGGCRMRGLVVRAGRGGGSRAG
jgi:hypothetical protein